jgi:hypothetical protein
MVLDCEVDDLRTRVLPRADNGGGGVENYFDNIAILLYLASSGVQQVQQIY